VIPYFLFSSAGGNFLPARDIPLLSASEIFYNGKMQISFELATALVFAIGGLITFVYGYGVLNERIKGLRHDHNRLDARVTIADAARVELETHVGRELSGVRESLARIEGALGVKKS
jgi:hypothetical protein